MYKFKVGDLVTVKNLEPNEMYGGIQAVDGMVKFSGYNSAISEVCKIGSGCYELDQDKMHYCFSEEMLEEFVPFKEGDEVKIRDDLSIGIYGNNSVTYSMLEHKGKLAKITGTRGGDYTLDIDHGFWNWTPQMLIKHPREDSHNRFKVGDFVTVRQDLIVDKMYGYLTWFHDMDNLKGRTLTVKQIEINYYMVETDYILSEEMLEPFAPFEKGDVVKIRDDLTVGKCGTNTVTKDMLKYRGKLAKVTGVAKCFDGSKEYLLDVDKSCWNWTPQMLIKLSEVPVELPKAEVKISPDCFEDIDNKTVYIKKVFYNKPYTITLWSDGTKTSSKCDAEDIYSPATGFLMCILKKQIGVQKAIDIVHEWLPTEKKQTVVTLKDVRKQRKKEIKEKKK